jgi:hypothetical protein
VTSATGVAVAATAGVGAAVLCRAVSDFSLRAAKQQIKKAATIKRKMVQWQEYVEVLRMIGFFFFSALLKASTSKSVN